MKPIKILAIAGNNFIDAADHTCKVKNRKSPSPLELVQRVIYSVDMNNIELIVLLGGAVDNGNEPGVKNDMESFNSELKKLGKPVIVVPGNLDPSPELVFEVFDDYEGLHEVEGYQIITFVDEFGKDDHPERSIEKMEETFFHVDSDRPIIVLQLNPIYPRKDSPNRDNLKNAAKIMKRYTTKGVSLSISGPAHRGTTPIVKDNVVYLNCVALCEEPFKYTIITLQRKEYEIKEQSLVLNEFGLSDLHVHTNYAYCSENVEPEANIQRAKQFGLQKIAFTEHAGQLYVSAPDYWSARYINEPDLIKQNRNTPFNRMKNYRKEMEQYRSSTILIGLEVEIDCNGKLTLLEEDADGWDILLGAVHNLPQKFEIGSKKGFIWANEALLRGGVDVLAHPFRYFLRNKLPVPEELFQPLAELLAEFNTAVELNYHTNSNDPRFFEICVDLKVPISLGSDAHNLCEVGALNRHLELLKSISPLDKLSEILY